MECSPASTSSHVSASPSGLMMECSPASTSSHVSASPSDVPRRRMVRLEDVCKDNDSISVLTYNVLADFYTPQVSYCSTMKWESRRFMLLDEIINYDSDVICLQKAQSNHLHNFWVPQLILHGYHHIHKVKKKFRLFLRNAGVYASDGCAIFYKPKKLNLVNCYKITLAKLGLSIRNKLCSRSQVDKSKFFEDNLAIAAVFELNASKNRVVVTTCYIHSLHVDADMKLMQVTELIRGLKRLDNCGLPIILCGDFNLTPHEQPYRFLVDGRTHVLPRSMDPLCVSPFLDLHHNLQLSSAYSALYGSTVEDAVREQRRMDTVTREPKFTTKVPGNSFGKPPFCGTHDYIFYQRRHMRVDAVLELVDLEEQEYLPSDVFPSDHISLMAEFTLVPDCSSSQCLDLPDFIWGLQADVERP